MNYVENTVPWMLDILVGKLGQYQEAVAEAQK